MAGQDATVPDYYAFLAREMIESFLNAPARKADKPAPAPVFRKLLHIINEFPQVVRIACSLARIARGINPGPPVQRIEFDAGIVRDGDQARGSRCGLGFESGVFLECFSGLFREF